MKIDRRKFLSGLIAGSAFASLPAADLLGKGSRGGAAQPPLYPADFSVFSKDDTLDVFLLVGQSNMKGRGEIDMKPPVDKKILFFHSKKEKHYIARDPLHAQGTPDKIDGKDNSGTGPGMSFAQTLRKKNPDMNVLLVPAAVGGAPIAPYGEKGKLYTRSLLLTRKAIKQSKVKTNLKAILWLQGESDSTDKLYKSYEGKLLDLVDRYRKDLKNPTLPFIACTVGSFITSKRFNRTKEINEVLLNLPKKRKYTACIDATDLKGHIGDRLHYNTKSQIEIGKRFAKEYLKIIKSISKETKN